MTKTQIPVLKEDRPKPKAGKKIIFILLLLFSALLGVLFFRSPISKVSEIQFTGSTFHSEQELMDMSGLEIGAQYFRVDAGEAEERLMTLGTMESVKVDKRFPGVVNVNIVEHPTAAYELDKDGSLHAILANGKSVPVTASGIAVEKPILTQWDSDDPNKAKLSETLAGIPARLTADISEILPSPTPSFPDRIKVYTRSKFVVITAVSLLQEKLEYLNQIIEMQEPGTITMLEADSYEPFNAGAEEEEGEEGNTSTQ